MTMMIIATIQYAEALNILKSILADEKIVFVRGKKSKMIFVAACSNITGITLLLDRKYSHVMIMDNPVA
jgi:hypothetical protein